MPASTVVSGVPIGYATWMKISPRSVGGMNSSPTTPSGTSEIASTNVTKQKIATALPCCMPHGSARFVYQVRNASKRSPNQTTGFHGFQCDLSAHRPANVGVTVNETNNEVKVEITTTIANSESWRPTWP